MKMEYQEFEAEIFNNAPMWNGIIAGLSIMALCFLKGKIEDKRGSFDKHIF